MQNTFDSIAYSSRVGKELVLSFESANFNTTPGLVGAAKEVAVREKLEQILPVGIAVGSGCVIDSYGNTSRQMDIVLYEKDICPVYRINNAPESTYYPCEGVIAVGEVKSSIGTDELKDIFVKIESVKRLRRFSPPINSVLREDISFPYRSYGSRGAFEPTEDEDYNQDTKPFDQIFGFSLSGALELKPETLCEKFAELTNAIDLSLAPNLIVMLKGGIVCPLTPTEGASKESIKISLQEASGFCYGDKKDDNFQFLLSTIYHIYDQGRTVAILAFNRYFSRDGIIRLPVSQYIPIQK